MARGHYDLPPLSALAAFEAAGRHASFKRAAAELNVTPGAVSHQIKALEQELGRALFLRGPGGVSLTAEGSELFAVLAQGFARTAAVVDRLRRAEGAPSVTVGATTAVAALWLMPRITRFWQKHPAIRVNQHASDLERAPGQPRLDLRIRYGSGDWPGEEARLLFDDEIAAVASPAFAAAQGDLDLARLAALPLIHLEGVDPGWATWRDWFRALGYAGPIECGLRVNNHTIALQAAEDGNGVALAWLRLVAPLLERVQLQPLGRFRLGSPGSFYITWPADVPLTPEAATLRDWLAAGEGGEPGSPGR